MNVSNEAWKKYFTAGIGCCLFGLKNVRPISNAIQMRLYD